MSSSRLMITVAAAVVATSLLAGHVHAQQLASGGVAFIDVNHIFEKHTGFLAQSEAIKGQMQSEESLMKQRATAMQADVERLQTYKPGTPEYTELERSMTVAQAEMRVDVGNKQRDFMTQQAKLYQAYYGYVQYYSAEISKQMGYTAVIKFRQATTVPDEPEAVLQFINRNVVYQAPGRDITGEVLRIMEQNHPGPAYQNTQAPTGSLR